MSDDSIQPSPYQRFSVTPSRVGARHLLSFVGIAAVAFAILSAFPDTAGLMVASAIPIGLTWRAVRRSDRPATTIWFIFLGTLVGSFWVATTPGGPASSTIEHVVFGMLATVPMTFGAVVGMEFDDYARRRNWH